MPEKGHILVVDDEAGMREMLQILLEGEGYEVHTAVNTTSAGEIFAEHAFDLVLTDIKMPDGTGVDLLGQIRSITEETDVILMTAYSDVESAIEAVRLGATDYIQKPFKNEVLLHAIKKALERHRLKIENRYLRGALGEKYALGSIVGGSEPMLKVYDLVNKLQQTATSVIVTGESGTGKELVARALHFGGPRSTGKFVPINCGAIPENLIESEIFGHTKGSFTGATGNKVGLFSLGDKGTVFFDEISELPLNMQVKLLRVLQEREVWPVGATKGTAVDARVVCASNKDIEKEVEEGRFREDLYFRLNVVKVDLPPLRERGHDIDLLAQHFVEKFCSRMKVEPKHLSPETLAALRKYRFPGNVRELENIIERAVALETSSVIEPNSLPKTVFERPENLQTELVASIPPQGIDLQEQLDRLEYSLLKKAMDATDDVKTEAAKLLGISFRSIRYRLSKYEPDSGDDK